MPFPWALAFKVIPWADVIAAAPGVARNAQKLWRQVGRNGAAGEAAASAATGLSASAQPQAARLAQLENALARLDDQCAHQAELLSTLAAQNAQLVQAVEVLRQRTRLLGWTSAALSIGVLLALAALLR